MTAISAARLILTSQMPVAHWHEQIGDPTIADSILDRLVHNAYRIELNGESMRKKRAANPRTAGSNEANAMQLKSAERLVRGRPEIEEAWSAFRQRLPTLHVDLLTRWS